MIADDVPEEFGNLTALETMSLVGLAIMSLPATITRLTRCNDWQLIGVAGPVSYIACGGVKPALLVITFT
jgi:hypothetical protein